MAKVWFEKVEVDPITGEVRESLVYIDKSAADFLVMKNQGTILEEKKQEPKRLPRGEKVSFEKENYFEEPEQRKKDIVAKVIESVHGNGAAGNRLANYMKAKTRKARQEIVASSEKSTYALPEMRTNKTGSKRTQKVLNDKTLSEHQKHMMLRAEIVGNKTVSDKKGTKRRLSASQVQK